MITLELLEEFCNKNIGSISSKVIFHRLYNTVDGFVFIHIMFNDRRYIDVSLHGYYEWLTGRRNFKLESIGI